MKKRLLSLLLAVLMIAGMAGSSLAAKEAFKSKLASTAEVKGVQVPRAGEHPYQPRGKLEFFGDLGEENFEQHFWWEGKNNLTGSDTFQAGHTYTYELVIMPPSGKHWQNSGETVGEYGNIKYTGDHCIWFDDGTVGKADEAVIESGGGLVLVFNWTVSSTATPERDKVEIGLRKDPGTIVPVHGEHPNTDNYLVTNSMAGWACRWIDTTEGKEITASDTFIGGHTYTLVFYITCDYGVTWKTAPDGSPDVEAILWVGEGAPANHTSFSYEWSGTKLVASWNFAPPPPTAAVQTVDEVDVALIDIPEAGKHPQFTGISASVGTVDRIMWQETGSVKELTKDSVFEAGKKYTLIVNLLPPSGKEWYFKEGKPHVTVCLYFSNDTLLLVGSEQGYFSGGVYTIAVSFDFLVEANPVKEQKTLDILGYVPPKTGASPAMTGFTLSAGTLKSVEWVDATADKYMKATDVYEAGHTYTAYFTLLPPEGKAWGFFKADSFPDVEVKIFDKDGNQMKKEGISLSWAPEESGKKPLLVAFVADPTAAAGAPKITANPTSLTAKAGDTVTFSVTAAGDSLSYQWYEAPGSGKEFVKLTDAAGKSGSASAKLTLSNVTAAMNGYQYTCVVTDKNGLTASSSAAVLTVTAPEITAGPESGMILAFSDVKESDWFYKWVMDAVGLGLINGKGKKDGVDYYDPNGNITLAEAVKLSACMHELYTTGKVTLKNGDPWYKTYADYAEWTAGALVSWSGPGFSAESVMNDPNLILPRGAFAWIFARSLPEAALPAVNSVPDDAIPDVKSSSGIGYYDEIYKLYRAGIVNGSDAKGTFNPYSSIKRSEVAAIVVRMMKPETRVPSPFN